MINKPAKLKKLFENIGDQIREVRKSKGITLEELADRVDRDWTFLSAIELGNSISSIETLFRISNELEIPLASLFDTHKPEKSNCTDPFTNKIAYLLKDASPKDKKTAVNLIKKLF